VEERRHRLFRRYGVHPIEQIGLPGIPRQSDCRILALRD
jgi:hypothetical protein